MMRNRQPVKPFRTGVIQCMIVLSGTGNKMSSSYYALLLFHYYVILPYKVKRTSKIRGRNTPYFPGLTDLQQGEYRQMQKERLWLNCRVFCILLLETRSQNKVGSYYTFKMPLEGWILVLKGQKMRPPCNYKTKSQRSEPQWLLKYLITPNFSANFQQYRLTTAFGPWNTFSDNDTWLKGQEFFKEHKKLKHRKVYGKITLPWR